MRLVLITLAVLAVAIAGGIAFFPMSAAAGFLADRTGDFRFSSARGSVWNGSLEDVSYGRQTIGDLQVRLDPIRVLGGQAAGKVGIARADYSGEAEVAVPFGGGFVRVDALRIEGNVAAAPGLPEAVRLAGGRFTLEIADLVLRNGDCEAVTGEAWTDALARLDFDGRWTGPELRGPVTCRDGQISVETSGAAPGGEIVIARMDIGQGLAMRLDASVSGAGPEASATLSRIGFSREGPALVLRRDIGGRPAG